MTSHTQIHHEPRRISTRIPYNNNSSSRNNNNKSQDHISNKMRDRKRTHAFSAAETAVAVRSKIALATLLASRGRTDATATSALRTASRGTSAAAAAAEGFLPPVSPPPATVVVAATTVTDEIAPLSPSARGFGGGDGGGGDGGGTPRFSPPPTPGALGLGTEEGGAGASASGAGSGAGSSAAGGGGERRVIKFSKPPSCPKAFMLATFG